MKEKQKINLVKFETRNNQLEVVNFEAVKATIETALNNEYKLFVVNDKESLKAAKEIKAELNNQAKEINDNKIAWVNDLTLKVKEQTKEICELIKSKSQEFDKSIKDYESKVAEELGNTPKAKVKFELTIKFTSEEELKKFIEKIPKKLDYTVKEK